MYVNNNPTNITDCLGLSPDAIGNIGGWDLYDFGNSKGKRPSTWNKHTKRRPGGKEKADWDPETGGGRKPKRQRPDKYKGPWPPVPVPAPPPSGGKKDILNFETLISLGLILGGVGIIVGTLLEDVETLGAGLADDPATIGIGVTFIERGLRYAQ
jgi:hypothetical protein